MNAERAHQFTAGQLNEEFDRLTQVNRALLDAMPQVSISWASAASSKIDVSLQAVDLTGRKLSGEYVIETWLADSKTGGETATAATSWTMMDSTVQLDEVTANKRYRIVTNVNGLAKVRIEGSTGWLPRAVLLGRVITGSGLIFT